MDRRYFLQAGTALGLCAASPALADTGFKLLRSDDGLIMPVNLNGSNLRGIFDCGASHCILDTKIANQLGIKPTKPLTGKAIYGDFNAGITDPIKCRIGDADFLYPIIIASLDAAGLGADLLIGRNILQRASLDLDAPNLRASFQKRKPRQGMVPVDITAGKRGSLITDVLIEGKSAKASLDSGSNTPLMISKSWASENDLLKGRALSSWITGDLTGIHTIAMTTLKHAALGGMLFTDVPAEISETQLSYEINLGLPFLERFRSFWDIPGGKLWVAATSRNLGAPFERERSGLAFERQNDILKVIFVAPSSPGAESAFKEGDQIARIDGIPVSSLTDAETQKWKHEDARVSVRLTLATGEVRNLTLRNYY
ncbi:hypothetical protein MMA231_02521 [Asticcacaulis sp. MM231]|uniref:aspartyl protease family protein n=1 Tax=Asticcacaulis sp. MM231 TaxID=3157666 RepID=UPI0032D5778A